MNPENIKELKPIPLRKLSVNPLVSVLMVNYNYAEFIGEAIESVMKQTYKNWELIICDDGSKDSSVEIIEKYQEKDSRIKLIKKENGGQASALNAAYEISSGEIICLLDSDDIFFGDKIEKVVNMFSKNESSGLCIHQVLPVDAAGKPINKPRPLSLTSGWVAKKALEMGGRTSLPPASGLSFRKDILEIIFPLPAKFNVYADGIIAELSQYITVISSIEVPLSKFRLHVRNATSLFFNNPVKDIILKKHLLFIETHKSFILNKLNPAFLQVFDFTKRENYWDEKLLQFVLESKPKTGIEGHTGEEMCSYISNKYRKLIWKVIIQSPTSVSIKLLRFWWSPSPIKKYLSFLSKHVN